MNDYAAIIKLLESLKSKHELDLTMSHDEIVNRTIHDNAIDKVVKTLKALQDGTINLKDLQ